MNLDGLWKAREADDNVRRDGTTIDTDDRDWTELPVPGHWQSHDDFATSDGPLIYRRHFTAPPPTDGQRRWLTFDGICYQGDAWLDGAYLGDPQGTFFPHSFDITALSQLDDDHVVALELTCAGETIDRRRNLTGALQASAAVPSTWNPGGIWRSVRVHDTGPVRIDRLRVLCRDADTTRAHLRLHARIDSLSGHRATLRTRAGGNVVDEHDVELAAGLNDVEWGLDLADPQLWWPRSLGDQPLTTIVVTIDVDGIVSDERSRRTGLREVAWSDWVCSINGERLFLKGANVAPTRPGLADAPAELVRGDVELAVDAGLDALRVEGHVARTELYDAADELGILILQDFPMTGRYVRSVRGDAVTQARELVDALGHHPSIVQWCAHDDPEPEPPTVRPSTRVRVATSLRAQLPTWNLTILDRWVRRALEQADPTRPTVAHSGVPPRFPHLVGTDSHLWYGWRHGAIGDLAERARALPSSVRFVSEFGAQSAPTSAGDFADADSWPNLDWDSLVAHHGLEAELLLGRFPPSEFPNFVAWRTATQRHQAELLRGQIEILRRIKYRPTGGFCLSTLADAAPMISFGVLDHDRQPKLAWQAVVDACRPVIATCDLLPPTLEPDAQLDLAVHVVNDLREAITGVVDAELTGRDIDQRWSFSGAVGADDCTLVGALHAIAPHTPGELAITITLRATTFDGTEHRSTRQLTTRVI